MVIGESAGGNLATSAVALISNPKALKEFAQLAQHYYCAVDEDISAWEYPEILAVSSWYGILDTTSFKSQGCT